MSRFINIGGIYLNLDHVRVIIDHEDGTCTIITDDGERYTNVDTDGLDFEGRNIIRAVIPCKGLAAHMERDGEALYPAIQYLCIMESGDVLPLEMLTECHDERFDPGSEYVGIIGGQ